MKLAHVVVVCTISSHGNLKLGNHDFKNNLSFHFTSTIGVYFPLLTGYEGMFMFKTR